MEVINVTEASYNHLLKGQMCACVKACDHFNTEERQVNVRYKDEPLIEARIIWIRKYDSYDEFLKKEKVFFDSRNTIVHLNTSPVVGKVYVYCLAPKRPC